MRVKAPTQIDWMMLDGHRFQDLCLDLLSSAGFSVDDQGVGPDGGVDAVVIEPVTLPDQNVKNIRWAAQFKFKRNPEATVKPPEVGNVLGLLARFRADGFFLVTNGRVTNKTLQELRSSVEVTFPNYRFSLWTRRHLEQRIIAKPEIAWRYFSLLSPSLSPALAVQITIDLEFDCFSAAQQRLLRHALAKFLEIPVDSVVVKERKGGSTKVIVILPADGALSLADAFQGDYLDLESLGFAHPIISIEILPASRRRSGSKVNKWIIDFNSALSPFFGDRLSSDAARELIGATRMRMYRRGLTDDYHTEEIFFESLEKAFAYLNRHGGSSITKPRRWLEVVFRNTANAYLSKVGEARFEAIQNTFVGQIELKDAALANPEYVHGLLLHAIESLPRRYQLLLRLDFVERLEPKEIQERMKISNPRKYLELRRRALSALKEAIASSLP